MPVSEDTNDLLPQIELSGVSKLYGGTVGVSAVSLKVRKGEFFSLLGPSGCGKSTLLKLIAGFEHPSTGRVSIAGRAMEGILPENRKIGFVFQNYALFPHMSVAENVAFGLEARGIGRGEVRDRVDEMLTLVELADLGGRRPNELSGGQQQRVALARALAIRPDVLLLDEPLSALDRKLREGMQVKLAELQRRLGVTTVFVTHDQEEALTMSDRIAVMSSQNHHIEQIGSPREIYERPANVLVSGFIGQINLWIETILSTEGGVAFTSSGLKVPCTLSLVPGQELMIAVRPERIRIVGAKSDVPTGWNCATASIHDAIYLGNTTTYRLLSENGGLISVTALNGNDSAAWNRGMKVHFAWPMDATLALPKIGEK